MRVLVLGGSWFLGRAVVEEALARSHRVTTFRRGYSGEDVDGVEFVRGDRTVTADLERLAANGAWDVVVDTSGYVPRQQLAVAGVLERSVGRFVFVSSVSAYVGWPVEPLTEDSPVLDCPPAAGPDHGYDADPSPTVYGFTKAGCERAVLDVFGPERTTILRPGVILGPHEYVGRLPWWLRRVQRGGRILAPGHPDRAIQPVDVRDVARWALDAPAGTFNLTGSRSTMQQLLRACADTVGVGLDTTWITDEQWLVEQGVAQWTELPLWRTHRGTWNVSAAAALRAGWAPRTLETTVADTWAWMNAGGNAVLHERAGEHGIDPQQEAAILGLWTAHELDRCG